MNNKIMRENIIKTKSFQFALNIVELCKELDERKEYVISKQLLRSGTSIGANIRESEFAESKADFIHKLHIALKEANESEYWLELLFFSNKIDENTFKDFSNRIKEIMRILIASIKKSKDSLNKK